MFPQTKTLLNLLTRDVRPEEPGYEEVYEDLEPGRLNFDDPKGFELRLKKKRRAQMLSAMMRRQGYEDLAKMASVRDSLHGGEVSDNDIL